MALIVTSITRVSTSPSGGMGHAGSFGGAFSPDGMKIAFNSESANLVPGDTNGTHDIFLKDLSTGVIQIVTRNAAGAQGNGIVDRPYFSPDGGKIMFASYSDNLVAGDNNFEFDIFIKDLVTGGVTAASTNSVGVFTTGYAFAPSWSSGGDKVIFSTYSYGFTPDDTNNVSDVFIKNLATGDVTLVSENASGVAANDHSQHGVLSPDGTKVAFQSLGTNLGVTDTNNEWDIYVKDLSTGAVTRVSVNTAGTQAQFGGTNPIWSPDGTKIAFQSYSNNLVPSDGNARQDVFIKDLATGNVTIVSATVGGMEGNFNSSNPVWSPDGTKIAFVSEATNLGSTVAPNALNVYVKDLATGVVSLISGKNGVTGGCDPVWSADGKKIAFTSGAVFDTNDTNNNMDIFIATLSDDSIIEGTSGDDTLTGTGADETFYGYGGMDTIHAGGGDDLVYTGSGAGNSAFGNAGNDTIHGGSGIDNLEGGDGDDVLYGHANGDQLYGGDGNDTLNGGDGIDLINGELGDDMINGGSGNDFLFGFHGNDIINGGSNNDTVDGGEGNDTIHGGSGIDTLYGWTSSDRLYGDAGDDWLYGGSGTNWLTGGADADTFVIQSYNFDGTLDKVTDFNSSDDVLRFEYVLEGFSPGSSSITDFVSLSVSGTDTILFVDRDGTAGAYASQGVFLLKGVTDLDAHDLYASGNITVV